MSGEVPDRLQVALGSAYRIERELGRGGMATVHLAQDLRHHRRVALKVLRPELTAILGAERFLAEIRVTANLQHPHILPLFDSGEAGSQLYYVMPFVEGESLRDRLIRERQLSVPEAVRIATEVASALDYAHRHGVIHRDIKPENVLLHDGQALVADFGIALAVSTASGNRMTETGLSLGTPGYMSPEQATGDRQLDARSDVYSLGCVLYEMLVGEPPHTGPTVQAVIAAVITKEPEWVAARRGTVPPHVAAAVHQALAKLPADRFDSAQAFARALAEPGYASSARTMAAPGARPTGGSPRQRWMRGVLLAAALAAGAGGGWLVRPAGKEAAAPATKFYLTGDSAHQITDQFALAPDGSRVVYVARSGDRTELYEQRFSELEPSAIAGTAGADGPVFFSPDGRWVGFGQDNALRRIRLDGSQLSTIVPVSSGFYHATWGVDGTIALTTEEGSGLVLVSAEGGKPAPLVLRDTSAVRTLADAQFLPDGRTLLCGDVDDEGRTKMLAITLHSGAVKVLGDGNTPRFVPPDLIVFGRSYGSLYTQHVDLSRMELTGPARRLAEGVSTVVGLFSDYDVASDGHLIYLEGRAGTASLSLVDRQGTAKRLVGGDRFWVPRVSPDGHQVAYGGYASGVLADIWIYDVRLGTAQRLTSDTLDYNDPVWSPDGTRLAVSTLNGRWKDVAIVPIDAPREVKPLLERPGEQYPTDWSPDGKYVIYTEFPSSGGSSIGMVPAGGGTPTVLAKSGHNQGAGRISPDGRWLAFDSDETGQPEIYLQPFPGPGRKVRVSSSGGRTPQWSRTGREVFYLVGDTLVAAQLRQSAGVEVESRTILFAMKQPLNSPLAPYDVMPDGRSFVVARGRVPGNRLAVISDIRADTVRSTARVP